MNLTMRVLPRTVSEPATEPATLSQLRAQVRVDDNADDAMLMGYLISARQHIENLLGRPIVPRTVRATFEAWPVLGSVELMMPVNSVDAVTYTDTTQAQVAWTGFVTRTSQGGVTTVRPASVGWWPVLGNDPVITIDATAGFTTVPEPIIEAICRFAAHLYANREDVVVGGGFGGVAVLPGGVRELIAPYRWRWL